jgi:hypothetical protein
MVMTTAADRLPIPTTPPDGWEFETPRYRVVRDTQPAEKPRFRSEPPFSSSSSSSIWQYGERPLKAGEIIETTEWPKADFFPLNYSAKKVLEFFNSTPKSYLPRSPWAGRIRLENRMSGPAEVHPVPPQLQPMDLRPHRK